ncbi:phosphatidylglycerophosphatase A [Pseudomonas sp. F1_0610]|uniref:phosphatidylglycerophosphatase A family protein n=1 Tax=Pseudomonas sp. F1_0610 TaxID=3114284 RepID=UPI0039C0419E
MLCRDIWHFLAFGLGSGLAPKAQGTWGSVVGLAFVPFLFLLPLWAYAAIIVLASIFGIWLCDKVSKDLGVHDHNSIVWDEFVGVWITLFCAPTGFVWLLVGFVLFRFFDILKPWPIGWADRKVHGGLGIMLDDIIAGVLAAAVLQIIVLIF